MNFLLFITNSGYPALCGPYHKPVQCMSFLANNGSKHCVKMHPGRQTILFFQCVKTIRISIKVTETLLTTHCIENIVEIVDASATDAQRTLERSQKQVTGSTRF